MCRMDDPALLSKEYFNVFKQVCYNESDWDYLKYLLSESNPPCDQLPSTAGYSNSPYLEAEFPITHGHCLHVDDLIPVKVSNASHFASSKDLLRPSTRLLCRVGRSIVAEQYRRMNLGPVKLEGVKPKKMTEEALKRGRELLQRSLPGAGVTVARLRWKRKNLGGLHKLTCVNEGCSYHCYSYEHLIKHLKMGHYVLEELLPEAEDDPNELNSPCLCYPVNPLKMTDHGKNIYLCQRCDLSFGSQRLIVNHYSEMHNENIAEGNDFNVYDTCIYCGELVEKDSHKLQVCRLQLHKLSTFIWNEIGRYLEYDPARGVGAHVLTSLMLFPNARSPLLMVQDVFNIIQEVFQNNLEDISHRFNSVISAFRGSYHFCGQKAYKGVVCGILDISELEKLQHLKRPRSHLDTEDGVEAAVGQKRSRTDESYVVNKEILLVDTNSIRDSFERKKKVIVIQRRSEDDVRNSSPHNSPSIVRIVHPLTGEASSSCCNSLETKSRNVTFVTELKSPAGSSCPSFGFPSNESVSSKFPPALPRILSVTHPPSGSGMPVNVRVSNPPDATIVTSALQSSPRMSTQTSDISKSRLATKIMKMNPVQSLGSISSSNNKTKYTVAKVSDVVEKPVSQKEGKSVLARNVAEEVAKKIAQKSSGVVSKSLPTSKQPSFLESWAASGNRNQRPGDSLSHSTTTTPDTRRRHRKRIDLSFSNSEDDPSVSYPFESPESANLIRTWLKRSGTDLSKVNPAELPREIAALFGLNENNDASSLQKNNRLHRCKYCGMSFEKLEILWAHCIRNHFKEELKAKSSPNVASTSEKRSSVGSSVVSVAKDSANYPLKQTSRFSVSPTSLVGIQSAATGSSSRNMDCQKGTSVVQENSDANSTVNRAESQSVENNSNRINLMCPECSFCSPSRHVIMKHVMEEH